MNHSPDDPDELVRRDVDLNHVTNMSYQMHVPDTITIGPNRTAAPRLNQDPYRLPVQMEVPDSIRIGDSFRRTDFDNAFNDDANHSSSTQKRSFNPMDTEVPSDEEYSTIEPPNNRHHQPIRMADSWHIEPFTELDEKNVLNKFQLLQNRIHHIERTLARRDFRDRVVYTCLIGYVLVQAFFSIRRST